MTIEVRIPGIGWDTFEGSGLIQQERPDLVDAFERRSRGFGVTWTARLPREDAERVWRVLDAYGDGLAHYSDPEARPEGRALLEAAARLRLALDV